MIDDKILQRKKEKSIKYANEIDRFSLESLKLKINSEHGERTICYDKTLGFSCTCDFYKEANTCSHIMSVKLLLDKIKNK